MPAQQPAGLRPDSLYTQAVGRARSRLSELTGAPVVTRVDTTPDVPVVTITAVPPAVLLTWNSDLPHSANDGPQWAGRGLSFGASGGITASFRRGITTFDVSFVPIVTYSANQPFQILPGIDPGRSGFASPWYGASASADLPHRFGSASSLVFDPGESNLRIGAHGIAVGAGTRARWWGPGVRNALVLSNNAPSIPQLFVETTAPVQTRLGSFTGSLLVGTLTESRFFDTASFNDYRSLSGLAIGYRPAAVSDLTLGLSRLVMRPGDGTPGRLFDAVFMWEPRRADTGTLDDGRSRQRSDQLTSLSAHWRFPAAAFEAYGELAWNELPRSLRELVIASHNAQGYTLGAQWAVPARRHGDRVRLQAEVTYLEQSLVFADRPPTSFYTGRATAHGFTQRGQVIGAAIGPGSSSQFLGADYVAPRWQAGAFVSRTRWDNDALYRQSERFIVRHDVTILSGFRAALNHPMGEITSELAVGRRLNYLFQNTGYNPSDGGVPVDVQNVTLRFSVTPQQRTVRQLPR